MSVQAFQVFSVLDTCVWKQVKYLFVWLLGLKQEVQSIHDTIQLQGTTMRRTLKGTDCAASTWRCFSARIATSSLPLWRCKALLLHSLPICDPPGYCRTQDVNAPVIFARAWMDSCSWGDLNLPHMYFCKFSQLSPLWPFVNASYPPKWHLFALLSSPNVILTYMALV